MAPGTDAAEPGRSDRPLVLIVEDDRETRQFYETIFAAHGFRTESAHNGFQALEKATDLSPDLILTDIAVPGLDGLELCRRLRQSGRTRHVPVLAVTGYADRHYDDRAIDAGADRLLNKACTPETLVAAARALLADKATAPAQ